MFSFIDEQKKLVDYLNNASYKDCRHKYIMLLLISTGMRIGEALVLDYDKDIDLEKIFDNTSYVTGLNCNDKKELKYFEF